MTLLLLLLKEVGIKELPKNEVIQEIDKMLSFILDKNAREAEFALVISQLRVGEIPTIVKHIFKGTAT